MNYEIQKWNNNKLEFYTAITSFYYPIIVLDGYLFEAVIKDDKTTLKNRNHLQIRALFDKEVYIIDVVKKEYFEAFLNILEEDHKEIVNAINKITLPKELRTKILQKNKLRSKKYKFPLPIECYYTKMRV